MAQYHDPETIRARARDMVRHHGPAIAGRMLGVSRVTVLSLAAGARVRPETFAAVASRLETTTADPAA